MSAGSWRARVAAVPPVVTDVGVAVAAGLAALGALSYGGESGARPVDGFASGLVIAAAAPLVARRRWPLAALAAVGIACGLYYSANYPGGPPNIPLLVALYTAAAAGHRRWSISVAVAVIAAGVSYRTVVEQESPLFIAIDSALFLAVPALGDAVHSRRALREEHRERLRLAAAEQERDAERRMAEERLRIAREVHDVLAHTVAGITVQAGVAVDVLDDDREQAREALLEIRAASREALTELRATIGVLRHGEPGRASRGPAPGLDQLGELVSTVTGAGLHVELAVTGEVRSVPAPVDRSAYRIVQESLTNVVRHARATSATVSIRYEPCALLIEVTDDGRGPGDGPSGTGYGLIGMAERATAHGGWVGAAAGPHGGFRVSARLPLGPAQS